jgi:hypothetical protein
MSYYRIINGKKYDKELLDLTEKLVKGAGDGQISVADAHQILEKVKDGNAYTDIEKETVSFIRDHFKWTDAADIWFRKEIRIWASKK